MAGFIAPIISTVGGVLSGILGSGAAHSAANQIGQQDLNAANLVQNAGIAANNGINQNAGAAGSMASTAAAGAGGLATNAAAQGQLGVSSATGQGQGGVMGGLGASAGVLNPFISTGQSSAGNLSNMLAPGGSLTQQFGASQMEQFDPGYQFRIDQGTKALQRAYAATGQLNSGNAGTALANYGQSAASAEYNNAFQRFQSQQQQQYGMQLGAAQLGVNPALQLGSQNLQAGEYNAGLGENAAQYNSSLGYNAATYGGNMGYNAATYGGNALMQAGLATGQNTLGAAEYAGNALMNKGQASAAGTIGATNAWTGALGSIANAWGGLGSPFGSQFGGSPQMGSGSLTGLGSDPTNLYGSGGYFNTMPAPSIPNAPGPFGQMGG